MTATRPEVCVLNMNTVIYDYHYYLEGVLNYLKCPKLKDHTGENLKWLFATILVDADRLESARAFNTEHLRYIKNIFYNISDPRSHLWENQKYNEVAEFIKKLHTCDEDVMWTEELITHGPLFNRIWVITVILSTQSGGNPLISRKSLEMIICLWFFPIGILKS